MRDERLAVRLRDAADNPMTDPVTAPAQQPETFWRSLLSPSLRFHWLLVLLMAIVIPVLTARTEKPGEFYPFSNFPMYSRFAPDTYYVYVTDLNDKPVPIGRTFNIASSDVKKAYDRRLDAIKKSTGQKARRKEMSLELRARAAEEVLRWLTDNSQNPDAVKAIGGIRLHQADVTYQDGRVKQKVERVGEIQFPKS